MPLLVTGAAGANGNGYGTLLAFDLNGRSLGAFSRDSRIADPRGLAVDRDEGLLFLNSGTDRVLALDPNGRVVRDSGPIEGLNPGGGNFGPDGRYYFGARSARTIMAFSIGLGATGEYVLPAGIVPFPRGFAFARGGSLPEPEPWAGQRLRAQVLGKVQIRNAKKVIWQIIALDQR